MNILGLMSGSSLDGMDMALVQFDRFDKPETISWKLLESKCFPWSDKMVKQLANAHKLNPGELEDLDFQFCEETAERINKFQLACSLKIDQISSHGHTIYHYPQQKRTLQIGRGKDLAKLTGLPVVVDFRSQDLNLGGQGAPLAPIVEKYLFPGFGFYLNLGGIANLTIGSKWRAFDICPCNQILNHYAKILGEEYDDKGRWASQGTLNFKLWASLNEWNYYAQQAPKSLDNAQLKNHFIPLINRFHLSVPDILHTFCHHIAHQIKKSIESEFTNTGSISNRMMVTGGGAYNSFLLDMITANVKELGIDLVLPSHDIIQYKEAILMALMAFLKHEGLPNCLASATGASHDHIAGTIYVN